MAGTSTGDKTEKASQQKLKKSRQEGQVVRSRDLASAIGILVSLKLFVWLLPGYYAGFLEIFHESFAPFDSRGALDNAQSMLFSNAMWLLIKMVLPLFVVPLFVVFAIIDVPAQAFFFAKSQRMSKHDMKEEHKSNEGRPEVKNRIRQLQRAMARRSARKTVPTADVVIVNPEHYAVALKYDEARAEAPYVIAKGVDEMALYIRQIAEEHKIEVLPLAPLARAIYNTSQVNQQIPVQLYQAVSQVLNYVLQLQAFRTGRRAAQPAFPNEMVIPSAMSEVVS